MPVPILAEPTSAQASTALQFDSQTTRNGSGEHLLIDRSPLSAEADLTPH
jgi:hypothetical protein